jgi:hypothetical protein
MTIWYPNYLNHITILYLQYSLQYFPLFPICRLVGNQTKVNLFMYLRLLRERSGGSLIFDPILAIQPSHRHIYRYLIWDTHTWRWREVHLKSQLKPRATYLTLVELLHFILMDSFSNHLTCRRFFAKRINVLLHKDTELMTQRLVLVL